MLMGFLGEFRELCGVWRGLWPHLRLPRLTLACMFLFPILGALVDGLALGLAALLVELLRPASTVPLVASTSGLAGAVLVRVFEGIREAAGNDNVRTVFLTGGAAWLALLAKNLLMYLGWRAGGGIKRLVTCQVRDALFRTLQWADFSVFEQRPAGELATLFHTETNRVIMSLDNLLLLVQRVAMTLVYMALIVVLSPVLAGGVVILGLGVGGVMTLVNRRLQAYGVEATRRNQALGGRLGEAFGGARIIRYTHSQQAEIERFQAFNSRLGVVEEGATRAAGASYPVAETLAVGGGILILGFANWHLLGPGRMSASALLTFAGLLLRMLPALAQVQAVLATLIYLAGGMREIAHWLRLPRFPRRPFGAREWRGLDSAIEFDRLSFRYPDGTVALNDLSFTIRAGATVALVGSSGSGKSTLVSLLLRLREPTSGRILVDGVEHWEFSPESWHRRIGVVEQEPFLFNDTLRNNVALGAPGATDADVSEALRKAHLGDLISSRGGQLQMNVGERGAQLSGGEKQRLAIARALVRRPLLLVLDEATSALDNESERHVQSALGEAVEGRTALVIAHRLSTVRNADWIVVLDRGTKVEEGDWETLASRGGRFSQLLAAAQGDILNG